MGKIEKILAVFDAMYKDAKTELWYEKDYQFLIAVLLSAQATDVSVNKVTPRLFQRFKTLESLKEASVAAIEEEIKSIGLYHSKAKNIKKTATLLFDEYDAQVPASLEALESLPGVGRKTANVVASVLFETPRIAVDTHVARVSKRLKLATLKDRPLKIEMKLMKKFPEDRWIRLHHQMILFGRYHCKAQNPLCEGCPLKSECRFPNIKVP